VRSYALVGGFLLSEAAASIVALLVAARDEDDIDEDDIDDEEQATRARLEATEKVLEASPKRPPGTLAFLQTRDPCGRSPVKSVPKKTRVNTFKAAMKGA
jgi:hypothetical protein